MLAKNLKTLEVLIYTALIESYFSHDEFLSVYNVLRQYFNMKEAIKKPQQIIKAFNLSIRQCYMIVWSVEKIKKVKTYEKVSRTLIYTEQLLILVFVVTGCVSISDFAFLDGI